MRRVGALLLAGALVASCSSDPTTSTASTAAPSVAAAAVVPEALCVRFNGHSGPDAGGDDFVYFAYTNAGSTAVAIPLGSGNVLHHPYPDDHELRPTVFAPGRVSPAFWAIVTDGEHLPSWELTGPDGTTRTATPDSSTPACTDELMQSTPPDTRQPDLTFADHGVLGAPQPPANLSVDAQLIGVPATSVCPAGLDPRPVEVSTDDGHGGSPVTGSAVTRTVPFAPFTDPATGATTVGGDTTVAALVVDVCAGAGAETRSWPAGAGFERVRNGVSVCFVVTPDGTVTTELRDPPLTCSRLAATGGIRTR